MLTDSPGLQFYSGNQLDGVKGKGQVPYIQYGGLALETQVLHCLRTKQTRASSDTCISTISDCVARIPGKKFVNVSIIDRVFGHYCLLGQIGEMRDPVESRSADIGIDY